MTIQIQPINSHMTGMAYAHFQKTNAHDTAAAQFEKTNAHDTATLQTKRQQLQNTLLLLKATGTDSGAMNEEPLKNVQKELETVSAELRAAKNHPSAQMPPSPHRDRYEAIMGAGEAPGIYQLRQEEAGYRISFSPYIAP